MTASIILLVMGTISILPTSLIFIKFNICFLDPCLFIRCHSRASRCIRRSPFKGQCICDSNTAGNDRTVCDGNCVSFSNSGTKCLVYSFFFFCCRECGVQYDRPNAPSLVEQILLSMAGRLLFLFNKDTKR